MEFEYFTRKTLLLLDAGSRILRYFIKRNEAKLPDKNICDLMKKRTNDIEASKLLQFQKTKILTTDVQEWDFSQLSFAFNLMAACVEFNESQKRFLGFLTDHRDMLHYSEHLEVRKSAFQSFSKCFETGLDAFSKDFGEDFIFDIRALISEIISANIERLEKIAIVRNEITNILLKEHLSTDDPERKSEIQQRLKKQLENSIGHITVAMQWLPNEENEQEDVHNWFLHTNRGSNSEAFKLLTKSLIAFGDKDDTGTKRMCVAINCQSARLLNLLQFLDGSESCQLLENISLEISKYIGKDIKLSLDAMHVILSENRRETDTYESVKDDIPVRKEAGRRVWSCLEESLHLCRLETDLWNKYYDDFSKLSDEIQKMKEGAEITKLVVICESHCGLHSFMNLHFGQSILPSSLAYITRVKHGESVCGVTIEATQETSSAYFVNRALSRFVVDGHSKEKEATEAVVVAWPFNSPILLDGVEWIFLPETTTESNVKDMIDDANGILFIANAGSSDCLKSEMIRIASSFDWKFPVFILNRWNHIQYNCNFDFGKPSARQHAYNKIVQQLRMCFPKMNEKQALRFQMTEATNEAGQKMKAQRLLEQLMRSSKWTDSPKTIRWFRSNVLMIREKVEKMKTEGTEVLRNIGEEKNKLRRTTQQKEYEIKSEIKTRTQRISNSVVSHVKSQTVRSEMTNWSYDDFPCSLLTDSNEKIQTEVQKVILKRLGRILERDMKSVFDQYRTDMLGMLKEETDGIEQQLVQAHKGIVYGSFGKSAGENIGYIVGTFDTHGQALQQTLSTAVLLGAFFSLGIMLLPLMFIAALLSSFTGSAFSTPHTKILKEASEKVIDGFNEQHIQEHFENQTKEVTGMVDKFFTKSIPAEIARLDDAEDNIRKTLKRYDEILKMLEETSGID